MHQIDYLTFSSRKLPKTIAKECDEIAEQNSDCGGGLYKPIRIIDRVFEDFEDARLFIEDHDSGWYDNLMVKYKDKRAIRWLVKIEYHT